MKDKEIIEEINDIISEEYNNGNDNWYSIAEIVYNKLFPEDSVVLSREEWKQIKNSLYYSKETLEKKLAQASKETVEKFAKDLLSVWDDLEKWSEKYYEPHSGITPKHIKEYAKQFNVEIKE